MTDEDKKMSNYLKDLENSRLLFKTFCDGLMYGMFFYHGENLHRVVSIEGLDETVNGVYPIKECKPCLRPMSSMTEEEKVELYKVSDYYYESNYSLKTDNWRAFRGSIENNQLLLSSPIWLDSVLKIIEFFNRNHFDYRGLISKGLALEAPEGMYNT